MRVLVVEDDARIAGLIRRILAENGYSVTVAATAPAGLEEFEVDVYEAKEGHGFYDYDNQVSLYTKMQAFFDKHIGKK